MANPTSSIGVIQIALVDPRPIFRTGLRQMLEMDPRFAVIAEAHDGSQALSSFARARPDILLFDVAPFGAGELGTLPALVDAHPSVKTIVMVPSDRNGEVVLALRYGARGIVREDAAPEIVCKAITAVHAGECWLSKEIVTDLVETLNHPAAAAQPEAGLTARFHLTPREIELLALIVAGYSNREIAKAMHVGVDTVKHHLTNIFDKTGASSRLELALFAVHHKIIDGAYPPPS